MEYASENPIPVTLELGRKPPNIFFADVMEQDDEFFDKALEGFAMFALSQGDVSPCPSRALVQESIYGSLHGARLGAPEEDQAGPSARHVNNDRRAGLGAGVWTRNGTRAYRFGRAIQAGRVWTNCYHAYPAHAAFGGDKASGIGRETHLMMLDHYQQTKNLLVSYSPKALGFF